MGCQESKTVKVQPFNPDRPLPGRDGSGKLDLTKSPTETSLFSNGNEASKQKRKRKTKSGRSLGSAGSLDDTYEGSDRGGSASSKNSQKSQDSGLVLEEDYSFVISEESHPDAVKGVENDFAPTELELSVVGVACPRRQSARQKRREEMVIIQALREEGLISLPKASSAGGLSFEVVMDTPEEAFRRPARLAKLEKRKKKRKVLTEDQIREKLERAEQRRKEKEQSKLDRIREWENKHEQITSESTGKEARKAIEMQVNQKMDLVTDKREKKLQQIQEKIRKQAEHAERVRQRKLAAQREAAESREAEGGMDGESRHPSGLVQVQPMPNNMS